MRLPEFVTELSPVHETLEAMEAGEAALAADLEDAFRQVHVDTADRGLALWEADFSLENAGEDGARRAAIKAALAGGRTLTPEYLEELCRSIGGGDWGQVNEDFWNWTVTVYAAAFGRLPSGAAALDKAVRRMKPAHLALEVHPAGVFDAGQLHGTVLTGAAWGVVSGDDGLRAGAARGAALYGGACRELSGGDGLRAETARGAALYGGMCREASGDDGLRAGASRGMGLTGGPYLELWASVRRGPAASRRTGLTACAYLELRGRTAGKPEEQG